MTTCDKCKKEKCGLIDMSTELCEGKNHCHGHPTTQEVLGYPVKIDPTMKNGEWRLEPTTEGEWEKEFDHKFSFSKKNWLYQQELKAFIRSLLLSERQRVEQEMQQAYDAAFESFARQLESERKRVAQALVGAIPAEGGTVCPCGERQCHAWNRQNQLRSALIEKVREIGIEIK